MRVPFAFFAATGAPAPSVLTVTPNHGPESTATAIVVEGTDFVTGCTVTINGFDCTSVTFIDSTEVHCDTPSSMFAGGPYNLTLTNPDTQSDTLVNAYTFDAIFDPATLSLTGWWRADYASSPWTGTASSGSSGSRDLTEATNPPSTGAAQNGKVPADFDGSNDLLSPSGMTLFDFLSSGAGSVVVLMYADSAAADAGAGLRVLNPGLFTDTDGYFHLVFSDAGAQAVLYDGSPEELTVACSTGAYHLVQVKYDGSNLKMRIDSGGWSSLAAGSTSGDTQVQVGRNFGSAFFDGRMLEVMTADTALSDADFDDIKSYVNATYALSL